MYPREQLEALAVRERALRWRIGERRRKLVVATAVAVSRVAWIDHAIALIRSIATFGGLVSPKVGGVALGVLGRFAPRLARLARLARWGALLAGPLRLFWPRKRRRAPQVSREPVPRVGRRTAASPTGASAR